jgi:hypothetical protein
MMPTISAPGTTAMPIPDSLVSATARTVQAFAAWLQAFGERSWDHQTFYAGPIGGTAKRLYYRQRHLGTAAVAPIVFCEAFLPWTRPMFAPKWRFPIADAHYAMAFTLLSAKAGDQHHARAVGFLRALEQSRSPGFSRHGWGYPFDWVTSSGTMPAWTPFITTTPYVYEAFNGVYALDGDDRWLQTMRSIAEHAFVDIKAFPTSAGGSSCGYKPDDTAGTVVNAAAYRAHLLVSAASDLGVERYREAAERNITFVLEAQQADGSWSYAVDGARHFVDHYHTCFVLKALAKIDRRVGHDGCAQAIAAGVRYYLANLFDEQGLPKPFARAPRLTVYERELYDYAECVNLCLLLRGRFPELNRTLETVLRDLFDRWIKSDGSFRSRRLKLGWDNVPMHRWAQSQMFRSLALLLHDAGARPTGT